jgi:hypothetical protein
LFETVAASIRLYFEQNEMPMNFSEHGAVPSRFWGSFEPRNCTRVSANLGVCVNVHRFVCSATVITNRPQREPFSVAHPPAAHDDYGQRRWYSTFSRSARLSLYLGGFAASSVQSTMLTLF